MPSAFGPFNFNDLPDEVHHISLQLLNPVELAKASSTCRKWHGLIMSTKAFWREVKIQEGCSKEKMLGMLQVFNSRSDSSLIKVTIERFIDNEEELREIFSAIESSASTIKIFGLLESQELNSLTRQLCRSLVNLQMLHSTVEKKDTEVLERNVNNVKTDAGLRVYVTDSLKDLEHEEMKWLSKLFVLFIGEMDSRNNILLVLRFCKDLTIFSALSIDSRGDTDQEPEPISNHSLDTFILPALPFDQPPLLFNLSLPKLTHLLCRIDQMERIETSSRLRQLTLILEDEDEGWSQDQADEYAVKLRKVLCNRPSTSTLSIQALTCEVQTQLQALVRGLLCSDAQEQTLILPELQVMELSLSQETSLTALARLVISRERYWSKMIEGQEFEFKISSAEVPQVTEKFKEEKEKLQASEFAE